MNFRLAPGASIKTETDESTTISSNGELCSKRRVKTVTLMGEVKIGLSNEARYGCSDMAEDKAVHLTFNNGNDTVRIIIPEAKLRDIAVLYNQQLQCIEDGKRGKALTAGW